MIDISSLSSCSCIFMLISVSRFLNDTWNWLLTGLFCISFWDLNIIHQVFRIVAAQFGQRRARAIKALAETYIDIAATKNNERF